MPSPHVAHTIPSASEFWFAGHSTHVSLAACVEAEDAVEAPLDLQLPSPVGLEPLVLSDPNIAPYSSFARSGALSSRPSQHGRVTQALVVMGEGPPKDMLHDERVTLTSSDPSCVEVVADLSSPAGYDYRALDGGDCTSATITATFTLGSWVESTSATVLDSGHSCKGHSLQNSFFASLLPRRIGKPIRSRG